jgi:hypothetical protein
MKRNLFILTALIFVCTSITAQDIIPRPSPAASVSQTIGYTTITITYCRPGVKDRQIWGDLVPYNEIWRTGANEATTIQFTTDVMIENHKVPAGKYSLFTIPAKETWTVILNKISNQWGAFQYNEKEDLLRFNVKPVKNEFTERLLFSFSDIDDSSCSIVMNWEYLKIAVNVKLNLTKKVFSKIKQAIAAKPDDFQIYIVGATYAADHGVFMDEAFKWVDKALSISNNFNGYLAKAKLFYKQGKYVDAIKEIERCREIGRNDSDYQSRITEIDLLEQRIKEKL